MFLQALSLVLISSQRNTEGENFSLLVSMYVARTVGVAKVNQCGIDHNVLFALFQKILFNKSFSWNTTLQYPSTSR